MTPEQAARGPTQAGIVRIMRDLGVVTYRDLYDRLKECEADIQQAVAALRERRVVRKVGRLPGQTGPFAGVLLDLSERRILIVGTKHEVDRGTILGAFQDVGDLTGATIVHGAALGTARIAAKIAAETYESVAIETHLADLRMDGRKAPAIRNQAIVDLGAEVCLAFPRGNARWVWDCVKRATKAGIPTRIYPAKEAS